MINKQELALLRAALDKLEEGNANLPDFTPAFDEDAVAGVIAQVAERMQPSRREGLGLPILEAMSCGLRKGELAWQIALSMWKASRTVWPIPCSWYELRAFRFDALGSYKGRDC